MSVAYANHVSRRRTPQSESILGTTQVKNSAGGHVWPVDCWTRLDRFLILGSEGGSYYASERTLTKENAKVVLECAAVDPARTVERIVAISRDGRAPKNDAAIFALALLASVSTFDSFDTAKRQYASKLALRALPDVCRIGTHLFQFIEACKHLRGWGRGLRNAVANWYTHRQPRDLEMQVTKYQQRNGWSHRDLMRLSHPIAKNPAQNTVFQYVTSGELPEAAGHLIQAVELAKTASAESDIIHLIHTVGLVREHIPTQWLNSPGVWEALLDKMPATAMVRNLGKMTAIGLLKPFSVAGKVVADRLADEEFLRKGRLHPMLLLIAQKVYAQGHGDKGSLTWTPNSRITDALDQSFYTAFKAVEPTGKRWLLALDVSGSMGSSHISGTSLTPREASAAMSLVTAATEPDHHIVCFSAGTRPTAHRGYGVGIKPLDISPRSRLTDAVKTVSNLPFGGTDCALPMIYATENNLEVDTFVIYTDSETWYGDVHPSQALRQYRQRTGIPAKLVVCGMVANGFTIADPNDNGMLDVVGFDTDTPAIMAEFAR